MSSDMTEKDLSLPGDGKSSKGALYGDFEVETIVAY